LLQNVIFVMTTLEGGKTHKSLMRHKATEVSVGGLDMWDKADVVRNTLSVHRKSLAEEPFNNQVFMPLYQCINYCDCSNYIYEFNCYK